VTQHRILQQQIYYYLTTYISTWYYSIYETDLDCC